MRTLLLATIFVLTALPSPAGEPEKIPAVQPVGPMLAREAKEAAKEATKTAVETMDQKVKTARTQKLERRIAAEETGVAAGNAAIKQAKKNGDEAHALELAAERDAGIVTVAKLRVELRWLKGELTSAACESAVKAAEEALAKAEKDKTPTDASKAALAKVTAERDEVARLEAAEKPKTPEPH